MIKMAVTFKQLISICLDVAVILDCRVTQFLRFVKHVLQDAQCSLDTFKHVCARVAQAPAFRASGTGDGDLAAFDLAFGSWLTDSRMASS